MPLFKFVVATILVRLERGKNLLDALLGLFRLQLRRPGAPVSAAAEHPEEFARVSLLHVRLKMLCPTATTTAPLCPSNIAFHVRLREHGIYEEPVSDRLVLAAAEVDHYHVPVHLRVLADFLLEFFLFLEHAVRPLLDFGCAP